MKNLYRIFLRMLIDMPRWAENALFDAAYPIYKVLHRKRAWGRVARHLERTGLSLRTSPREVFKSLYANYLESLRYLSRNPRTLKKVHFEHEEIIREPLAKGIPIVAMGIHQGAFEIMHRVLTRYSDHVYLFTHDFKNRALTELLHDLRKTPGLEERPTDTVARTLREFLRNKGILAMLVDQATDARGNPTEILGLPAELFMRLPLKALALGAGIVTFRTFATSRGHIVRFETFYPPKENPDQVLADISDEISRWIFDHPEQWTWNYHRNFTQGDATCPK